MRVLGDPDPCPLLPHIHSQSITNTKRELTWQFWRGWLAIEVCAQISAASQGLGYIKDPAISNIGHSAV